MDEARQLQWKNPLYNIAQNINNLSENGFNECNNLSLSLYEQFEIYN
jgi:hypothetical protein